MGSCLTPFIVKDKMKNCSIPVPCGRCPECHKRRANGWAFRLMQEEKRATSAFFITLTYDTAHVPITKSGYLSLDKRDCQLMLKRLRKDVSKLYPENPPLKYYLAGEYGGKGWRPHYHIILFNLPPTEIMMVEKHWQKGKIQGGSVTAASVAYTLKYMCKPKRVPVHRNDDRLPEFGLMSKGLGEAYLTDAVKRFHKADLTNRMVLTIEEGKKIAMPRYYKLKLYTEQERKTIAHFQKIKADETKNIIEREIAAGRFSVVNKVAADLALFAAEAKNYKKDKF